MDFLTGLFSVFIGIFNLFYYIPATTKDVKFSGQLIKFIRSPAWFPEILSVGFIVFGIFLVIGDKNGGKKIYNSIKNKPKNFVIPFRLITFLLILFIFYFSVPYIGFLYCSIALVAANLIIFGETNWKKIIAISVFFSVLIYLTFTKLLNVPF